MTRAEIDLALRGREKVDAALGLSLGQTRDVVRREMREWGVMVRGHVVEGFGRPGRPKRRTGALSRGVRTFLEERGLAIAVKVGVSASVPYGRILNEGGVQPARVIVPVRAKALRWFGGTRKLAFRKALSQGATYKQATRAANRAVRRGSGAELAGLIFAKRVKQRARYQRAMPYLDPPFLEDLPLLAPAIRDALVRAGASKGGARKLVR